MAGNARRRAERRKRNKAKRREVKDMRHCIAKDMKHGVRTYKDNGKSEDSNSGKSKDSNKEIPRNDLPHSETIGEDDADGITRSDQEQDDKTITNPDYVKGRTRSNSGDSNDSEQIDKNALNVDNGIDDDTTREIFNTPEDMEMDTASEEDINDEHSEPMNNTKNCKSANDSSGINMEDPKNMSEKNMGSSVFPGACTPLHYFMSVANRIQTQLCNIVDNDCLFEKILRAVDTNNKADETRQEYDIDIEQYISDIVDDDEEIEDTSLAASNELFQGSQPFSPSVPDGKSKDLFKQQLLRDFYHLLGAFDKSWKEDFLNCYVGKIASLEDRVKAMILCPQMEKFYLYKCKMVLDSVRINPGVPLAPLERIYDQLEEALQYTEKSTLPLNKKEVAREILQTRNYYAEERKRLLQIFPELEPFVKTIQHVELEMSRLDGFCLTNDQNGDDDTQSYNKAQPEQFPPNLDKLQLIPGVRDLILQAQKIPRPEQYNLFEPTVQPMGNLAKPQRTSKVQNQNMNDSPSLSERHYKESSLPGLHTDATHPSSYTNYKCTLRHNTDSMETGEHQQLSGDVQLFFRQYENLYNTRRDTDTNDPTAWLAPEDTKNVRSHLTSTRPNPMDEPNMLPHEAALPTAGQGPCLTHGSISGEGTKYGAKCHPSKVVGHKYFGPCRPDLLKRKSKYSAKSLVNKRKISKDKKIPYKILTRGKTLEDFIYETNHAKPVRALGDPSTTRRNVNRNSQHRTTSSSLSIKYVSNDSKYASNERKYASDERKYAPHESKYTANDSKYASNERKYGSDERKYASSDSELVSNDQYLSDDYPYMEYDGSFIPRDKYVSNESQYASRGNKYVPSKYASNDLQYVASDKYIANDEYDSSSQHIQRKYASTDHKPYENQFATLSTSHQYKSLSCNKLESKKDLFSTTCKRTLFRISQSCVNTRLTTENSHQGSRGVQTKCLASTSEHCPRSEEAERHSNRTQSREHCAEQEIYEYCPQNNYSKVRRTSNKINKDVTLDWLFRFKTHKSGSRTDSSGKTESHHYSHSIQDPPKSHPYPTTQTLQSHHTTLLSQLTTVHHSRRTTSHNSLHKSDKMKRALNLAYSSETLDKGFNFVSVRETLKRFRIYRHRSRGEKKTDQQISVELMLTRLRPGDVFKYNINHYV